MTTSVPVATRIPGPQEAQQHVDTTQAALKAALAEVTTADRALTYRQLRHWPASHGMPGWVLALIAGSAAAFLLSVVSIFAFGLSLAFIFAALVFGYAVFGGIVLWFFRGMDGETAENVSQIRAEQVERAKAKQSAAVAIVKQRTAEHERALAALSAIQETLQSEAYERQLETNRLLSVEAGRLYPDEFERYVADIFRHLGFTVEVVGQSGDQGVDVLACRGSLRLAVQAKRYQGAVGNAAVQEVFAGMAHHRCHRCVVVTNSTFTLGAAALALSTGCVLISADEIGRLIRGEIAF